MQALLLQINAAFSYAVTDNMYGLKKMCVTAVGIAVTHVMHSLLH